MAEKKSCNMEVTEIESGYKLEITGEKVKSYLSSFLERCSSKKKEGSSEGCC